MMGWLDDLFLNKGVSKEAEQTNRDTEWDKKLKTSSWLSETLKESDSLDAEATKSDHRPGAGKTPCKYCDEKDCDYSCDESQAGGFSKKEAAYVLDDTVADTVKKDYELAVEGMSDSNIAEMLAEFNLIAEGMASDPLKATEEKEKQMKYVSGNRKAAEEKLLKAVGEHTLLDWKEKFKSFKEAKPVEVKSEELYEPKFEPKKQNWEKKEEFEAPSDKEKTKDMAGIGKEEDKGQVGKKATLMSKPVNDVKTADEARQIAIDWQAGQSEQNPSYGELAEWGNYFQQLVVKFPELAEEFAENGIVSKKEEASQEIESKASKEEIVTLFKTAEIASPWGVVKDEQGNDAIAKLTPEKTTKESDKDDQDDLVK